MEEKYLRVTMPDGSRWDVPARIIAEDRAKYYARVDADAGEGTYEDNYASEYQVTLESDDDLKDWAANNMNWSDVASQAQRMQEPPPLVDMQEGWTNGKKEIVEH